MKIVGIGLDLVKIGRVRKLIERWQDRALCRIFTKEEQEFCYRKATPYPSLAGRFAVKEAVLKALGTGWAGGIRWVDIQVVNDHSGRPMATTGGKVDSLLREAGVTDIHISISHDAEYAIAQAILTDS